MERDPIIEEIHAVREAFAREHNYDMAAMIATFRRHQRESGREVVSFSPRRLEDAVAAPQGEDVGRGSRKISA